VNQDLQSRIERMYSRDRAIALLFVAALWIVIIFVMLAVSSHMGSGTVVTVAWIAACIVGLFNTAAIIAMIRHYAEDKQHIYSIDIRHLDAGR
jgi:hypothetical protein